MLELVLMLPSCDKYFILCIDDNKRGISRVIMQERRVASYNSMKLKVHKNNYQLMT
jgi:hypothetical protein